VLFTPDGAQVLSAGGDDVVRVYTLADGTMRELAGNKDGIKDIALSRDGKLVASAGIDQNVNVWTLDGAWHHVFEGHAGAVKGVDFAADGQLVSGAEDDVARVWQLAPPEQPPTGIALRKWLAAHTNIARKSAR